jgi:hypothetical protein
MVSTIWYPSLLLYRAIPVLDKLQSIPRKSMAALTLERSARIEDGSPVLQLAITASVDIDANIFKHKVSSVGPSYDPYVSICTLEDLSTVDVNRGGGPLFYRKNTATISYSSINAALEGKTEVLAELQLLLDVYNLAYGDFIGDDVVQLEDSIG